MVVAIFIVQIISSAINMFPVLNTYTKTLIWGLTLIAVMVWRMFSKIKGKESIVQDKGTVRLVDMEKCKPEIYQIIITISRSGRWF